VRAILDRAARVRFERVRFERIRPGRVLALLAGLAVLDPGASSASGAPIVGFGAIPFGATMEEVLDAHPGARLDAKHPDRLTVEAETPGFVVDPTITFTFHRGRLEEVFVYGPIMDGGLGKRLTGAYGRPGSVREVALDGIGDATEAVWEDGNGNRLTLLIYHGPHDVSLRYASSARVKREAAGRAAAAAAEPRPPAGD
jgi:hypothetical protein